MSDKFDNIRDDKIWSALLTCGCLVSKHDFQKYKRSNPPDIDADPIILLFPASRIVHVRNAMEGCVGE